MNTDGVELYVIKILLMLLLLLILYQIRVIKGMLNQKRSLEIIINTINMLDVLIY